MTSETEIKNMVNWLLDILHLHGKYPIPIEDVAHQLGFKCHYFLPDDDVKDIETAYCHAEKKIYISQFISVEQQRFSIAQKIGHIFLHGAKQDYIDNISVLPLEEESEAALFAQYLLLPENGVVTEWLNTLGDVERMARFFCVASHWVTKRVENLGL